jgi:hypothetical protein
MKTTQHDITRKYFDTNSIKLAYFRVNCWSDRTVKDVVGLRAFGNELEKNCKYLSEKIISGEYRPSRGFKYYMPKPSKTLRTRTLLKVEDAIIYQAIVNKISEVVQPRLAKLNDFVFGSVLSPEVVKGENILLENEPSYFFFKFWKFLYQDFKKSLIHSITVDKVKFKFETDITGFFDSIPHYNLLNTLSEKFGVEDEVLDILSNCLNIWSGTKESITPGVGIPQGPQPSFFLANLLLHDLDDILISEGYKYYRYMDDIHIYGYSSNELLNALLIIDKYTKGNGLSINSKKTSIVQVGEGEADTVINELKTFNFSISNTDEELSEREESFNDKLILSESIRLSQQDQIDNSFLQINSTKILTNKEEIIAFWRDSMKEVETELFSHFQNPEANFGDLVLKEDLNDVIFIQMSAKYGKSFHALVQLDEKVIIEEGLIKYWLTIYQLFFWRINLFGFTLMSYGKNNFIKENLIQMIDEFEGYEWVKYYLLMHLSLTQEFKDKELRIELYKKFKNERSQLVRISYYRLFFKHSTSNQFKITVKNELQKESSNYLKLIITDFVKNKDIIEMDINEFIESIGL